MATTYTVKPGDTLGKIAKSLGVGQANITGYRSGDPNVIYPGETLSVAKQPTTPGSQGSAGDSGTGAGDSLSTSGSSGSSGGTSKTSPGDYLGAVKSFLSGNSTSGSSSSSDTLPTDSYLTGLQKKLDNANSSVDSAAKNLSNLRTTTFNDLYSKSNLDTTKNNIQSLDNQIGQLKSQRDATISTVRQNPGLSSAQITGRAGKLTDKYNAQINDLIGQRNSLASDYNNGLQQINNEVSNTVGDATTAYNAAKNQASQYQNAVDQYQNALVSSLNNMNSNSYRDASLALSLANAERLANSSGSNLKLATSTVTGEPLYWYDASGNIYPLSKNQKDAASGTPGSSTDTSTSTTDVTPAPDNTGDQSGSNKGGWWNSLLGFFGF